MNNHQFNSDASEVYTVPCVPDGGVVSLAGAGAINPNAAHVLWTPGGAVAGTLADGTVEGQVVTVTSLDANDGTLTPASFHDGTSILFTDTGDRAVFMWRTIGTTTAWQVIDQINLATGLAGPQVS